MYSRNWLGWVGVWGIVLTGSMARAADMGTAFTYQGYLEKPAGTPLTATCNFLFAIWNHPTSTAPGDQVGFGVFFNGVPPNPPPIGVDRGIFTANLDMGSDVFTGPARWLAIAVQCPGDVGLVMLTPRVELTPAPYALWAAKGVGPPGVLDVTPTGQLSLTNEPGTKHLSSDADNLTITALNDIGPAPMTIRSGSSSGDNTWMVLDDVSYSVTIGGEAVAANTAGITPPPKLAIRLVAETMTAAAAGAYVSIAAYQPDGVTAAPLRLNSGDPNTMNVTPAGKVGIGTEAPSERLDVAGNIHASGTITSGSSITIDGTSGSERISSSASLDLRTAAGRALRLENNATSPNLIGGYSGNTVTAGAMGATVGGGGETALPNQVTDDYGTVGGGRGNKAGDGAGTTADRPYNTVGGGWNNTASSYHSTVGGGWSNTASNWGTFVGGGANNTASDWACTVAGGEGNTASGDTSTVGGGGSNIASGYFATVGGGFSNDARGTSPTVGGGYNNTASGDSSFVGGGADNTASGGWSTVGGGNSNYAGSFCVGGANNGLHCVSGSDCPGGACPLADYSTVGGGLNNTASGLVATVGGGSNNTASGSQSTVGGGSGNTASGAYSIVSGGSINLAGGDNSFAAGLRAIGRQGNSTLPYYSGDADGDQGTFIWADASTADDFISSGANQFLIRASGGVGMGTASATAPRAQLDVVKSGATVAVFDRTTSDGTIISLRQAGTEEGTISVSGVTVSYNAFTGSHYAWTDETIARGTLVTLTGVNRSSHENPESERIYGIAPTTKANDPQCLGAYLGLLEPGKPQTSGNPHQVMAVGNGDMWVVDTGRNIEPGQYLISSDVKGHAMLDDEARFPVGYVIARAGEPVKWANVSDTIDGHKHKRISVFFESFERGSVAQQGKIEALGSRVAALERALSADAQASHPVSPASIGVLAIPALALLGFVGLIVRSRAQNGGGR